MKKNRIPKTPIFPIYIIKNALISNPTIPENIGVSLKKYPIAIESHNIWASPHAQVAKSFLVDHCKNSFKPESPMR